MSMMDDQLDARVQDSRDAEHDTGAQVIHHVPSTETDAGQATPGDDRTDDQLIADLRNDLHATSTTVLGDSGENATEPDAILDDGPSAPGL